MTFKLEIFEFKKSRKRPSTKIVWRDHNIKLKLRKIFKFIILYHQSNEKLNPLLMNTLRSKVDSQLNFCEYLSTNIFKTSASFQDFNNSTKKK